MNKKQKIKNKKWIIGILGIVAILAIVGTVGALNGWFGGKSGESFASTLLPDYQYRRPITLSGQTSDLTDYQVKIELPASLTSQLVSDGKLQSDFDDIRFTDADDNQLLNFWIETATTTATSIIWVKVPGLSASKSSTIYMYYGNPSASSASNGDKTFEFFDDFSGDLSKWTVRASMSIISGELDMPSNEDSDATPTFANTYLGTSYVMELKAKATSGNRLQPIPVYLSDHGVNECFVRYITCLDDVANQINESHSWGSNNVVGTKATYDGSWHNWKIVRKPTSVTLFIDGDAVGSEMTTSATYDTSSRIGISGYNTAGRWDDVRVRKYASPEPTATVGSEQTQITPIAHWRMDEGSGTTIYDSSGHQHHGTLHE